MLSSHGAGPGELLEKLLQRTRKRYRLFHLIWNYGNDRNRVSFPGKYYRLENAQAGPSPYHRISIWTGAVGPRMMRLIGRLTDGWVNPLSTYTLSDEIRGRQRLIDESAKKNGRSPESIRRIAQVVGVIDDQERSEASEKKPFFLHEKRPFVGSVSHWVDWARLILQRLRVGYIHLLAFHRRRGRGPS